MNKIVLDLRIDLDDCLNWIVVGYYNYIKILFTNISSLQSRDSVAKLTKYFFKSTIFWFARLINWFFVPLIDLINSNNVEIRRFDLFSVYALKLFDSDMDRAKNFATKLDSNLANSQLSLVGNSYI